MSKPIDSKTVSIYDHLKKKPALENKIINFNSAEIYDVLNKNSNDTVSYWFKLQQAWCNNAYNTFKDYDSYLILIYLVNEIFKKYSDRFQYLTYDEFYEKKELIIEKINLIEISKDLNIPKETIRRKVNFLQEKNIIFRKGKSIFFNSHFLNNTQRPANSKQIMSVFLEKSGQILAKEDWFGRSFNRVEIEKFIDKYFTICWQHWFRLQIPFLVRHRTFYGDLETWNVWGSIGISQFSDYNKQVQSRVIEDPRSYADLYLHLLRHTPKNGINASSISEISNIPRATVIRKLKTLLKQKLILKNNKLEYMLLPSPKNIKSFEQNYMHNQKYKAGFVTTIFDLMKYSSFKVE